MISPQLERRFVVPIKLDKIKYQDLIDMGFARQDIDDEVCYRENGYYGFNLSIEFPFLNIGISTPCKIQNESKNWEFIIYKSDSGDIIRNVEFIEVKYLIEYFTLKSEEIRSRTSDSYKKAVGEEV